MDIRKVKISKLKMATYNPRVDLTPDDGEYMKIEKSINEFGYIDPIIWNEATGNVVGGHQRLKILIAKGYKEVEVSVVNIPNEAKEKALNSALNKISGKWDYDKLADVFTELKTADVDELLTGFENWEIDDILEAETDVDDFFTEKKGSGKGKEPKTITCPHCGKTIEL